MKQSTDWRTTRTAIFIQLTSGVQKRCDAETPGIHIGEIISNKKNSIEIQQGGGIQIKKLALVRHPNQAVESGQHRATTLNRRFDGQKALRYIVEVICLSISLAVSQSQIILIPLPFFSSVSLFVESQTTGILRCSSVRWLYANKTTLETSKSYYRLILGFSFWPQNQQLSSIHNHQTDVRLWEGEGFPKVYTVTPRSKLRSKFGSWG